jgi:hypothetical protein
MKINVTAFIVVTLALIAGVYWFFFAGSGNDAFIQGTVIDNPAQAQFQSLASQLDPITFDTSIFSDPAFTSLVDLTTPITPEEKGRLDPFAPIPGVAKSN